MFMPRSLGIAGLAALVTVGAAASAHAQPNFQKVKFTTVDGVEIRGAWYPAGRNAPVALFLHDLTEGESSAKREWNTLAKTLQGAGYAVLAFDFRGYGDSTAVTPQFQTFVANRGIKIQPGGTIDAKDFPAKGEYNTILVNDIAAAKAFLDGKNDAGDCNSSALILIGAGKGATLGALWMKAEHFRYRYNPPNFVMGIPQSWDKHSQGKNIAAAIWLSYSYEIGNIQNAQTARNLNNRAIAQNATPVLFVYNGNDEQDKKMAEFCAKLKDPTNKKHKFIDKMSVSGAAKNRGRELLTGKTVDLLLQYLKAIKDDGRFNDWQSHNFQMSIYQWVFPNGRILAHPVNADNIVFDTYLRFIGVP